MIVISIKLNIYDLDLYRNQAAKAAKELGYGKKVVEKIKAAKTESEIRQIMKAARAKKFGD